MLGGFLDFAAQTAGAIQFQISDAAEFSKIINTNAVFTTNLYINSWIEGPVWIPNGQYLVFSDTGNNKLKRLDPPGTLSDFLSPPAQTKYNGNTLDFQERLVSCQCGSNGLKVVLTTNGAATALATDYHGLKFYSPNDIAVKSDGSIWFTDPGYDSGLPLPLAKAAHSPARSNVSPPSSMSTSSPSSTQTNSSSWLCQWRWLDQPPGGSVMRLMPKSRSPPASPRRWRVRVAQGAACSFG